MFHFPEFASYTLCIQVQIPSLQLGGLPHSDIPGSQFVCNSPGLFAACHVLHRLPMPRHPPHALNSLTRLFVSSARILKASCLIRSLCSKLLFKLSKNTNFSLDRRPAAALSRAARQCFPKLALLLKNDLLLCFVLLFCCPLLYYRPLFLFNLPLICVSFAVAPFFWRRRAITSLPHLVFEKFYFFFSERLYCPPSDFRRRPLL